MGLTNYILKSYFKYRQAKIEGWISNPFSSQNKILRKIIKANAATQFGTDHQFLSLKNGRDYRDGVPVRTYEELYPYIRKMLNAERNILCHSNIKWFAKSSGTTTGRSKYIPVAAHYLKRGHLKCAWDNASFIYNEDPEATLFQDKSLIMGGSIKALDYGMHAGDISAIILHHFPSIGRRFYTPDLETALMSDWEAKIKKIAAITGQQNLTLIAGVPTWTLVLLDEVLAQTGKKNISEVWPNLKNCLHGGVGFEPYRDIFNEYIPSSKLVYREVYNASEGYFAIQNEKDEDGMILLCDHEIYYEFVPIQDVYQGNYAAIPLSEVKENCEYAMVISNTSGLYRYLIGDIVKFVSILPYKIKVSGRIHQQLNTFGEELSIANVESALALSCQELECSIIDFTVAPVFMRNAQGGAHEWLIEFIKAPVDMDRFTNVLDSHLRSINSDYDAKRSHDLVIRTPQVISLPRGTFELWLMKRSKLGHQNKIPRLSNERTFVEELKSLFSGSEKK